MASIDRKERERQLRSEVLETAPGFILLTGIDGPWIDYLCRHYGYTTGKLNLLFPTKQAVINFLLKQHLELAFEAVCGPWQWTGEPMDVLRGMSLELICYGSANIDRHRVFLAEYERGSEARRSALAQRRAHLVNNYQLALHAVLPARSFKRLRTQAEILFGQLLHAPLWWPSDVGCTSKTTTHDAWVCTQLGLLTGLRRPDHRRPSGAVRHAPAPAN